MLDIDTNWTADDLPTLEGSEVSALSSLERRCLEDVDLEERGMRWLLERPEALLDARQYGRALGPRHGRVE